MGNIFISQTKNCINLKNNCISLTKNCLRKNEDVLNLEKRYKDIDSNDRTSLLPQSTMVFPI